MSLRDHDDSAAKAWLGRLERDGAKALSAPVFSGYGGQGYGGNGGLLGAPMYAPWQPGAKHDYQAEAGDTWRNSAVAACLAWYADNFPEPGMRVVRRKRDGSEVPVPDHPLVRLLQQPNPYQSWHSIAKGLVTSYRTDGNAFLMIAKSPGHMPGDPLQLWWLPHFRVWPRWDTSGNQYLGWWDYQVDGRVIKLGTDQVVHFRDGIDPYNDRLGMAALKSTLREVCSDNQGAGYTASIMRNMGVVGYMLSPSEAGGNFGDKDEREEMASVFQERYAGENRGRPGIFNHGVKVDRLGMTPEELALDRIMAIPESRICAAMRLPAMVVGLAVGAEQRTFANYAEARRAAYEDGIIPLQKEMAATINRVLLPLTGDPRSERFEFDYGKVQCLSESEDARFVRYGDAYMKNRLVVLNEARAALGLEPTEGGDRFADGSTPEEGPQAPPPPVAPGQQPPGEGDEPAPDETPVEDEAGDETKALVAETRELMARVRMAFPEAG
jgi:HK97 family phage portal protein